MPNATFIVEVPIHLLPLRASLLQRNLKTTRYLKSTEHIKNPNWRSQIVERGDKRGTWITGP